MEDGQECTRCAQTPVRAFKSRPGVGKCCPSGTYDVESNGAYVVESNGTYVVESNGTGRTRHCVCLPGFTATEDGVECISCETGTYKNESGIGNCYMCPFGSSSATGSDALMDCMCLSGTYFVESNGTGSTRHCVCLPGFTATEDGVECIACETGTYKNESGIGN